MPNIDLLDTDSLTADVLSVIADAPMPGLGDQPRSKETRAAVQQVVQTASLTGTLQEAGLWLLAGELDLSHNVSQSCDSQEGSFWHGIMHRREGDFGNSKYWFRRVGRHPVHQRLATQIEKQAANLDHEAFPVASLLEPDSLAENLVDLCQSATRKSSGWKPVLEQICWWEWQLLYAIS